MKMSDLPLMTDPVSITGILSGDYFAVDDMGYAVIYQCRTYAHGVIFDDRKEPKPFRIKECYALQMDTGVNVPKLQHQCMLDRNKALGIVQENKSYESVKSEELASKYSKKKKN